MGFDTRPTVECQSQESPGLSVQSFKETAENAGILEKSSTSISTGYNTNSTTECHSQETVDLDPQTCKQSRKETRACDGTVTMTWGRKRSKFWNYFEELNNPSLVFLATKTIIPEGLRQDGTKRKTQKVVGLFQGIETFAGKVHDLSSTSISTGYNTNPTSKCQSQKTVDLDPQTYEQSRKETRACDGPSTSTLVDYIMDNSAERQSQDTSSLPVQSFKETTRKTGVLNEPSTSSSTGTDMDPNAERQTQETVDLALQSCEQSKKETRTCDRPSTSSSTGYIMDPSTEKNVILQHQNRQNRFPVITSVLSGRFISKDALAKLGRLKTIHSAPTTEKNHLRQSQKQEPPGLPVQSFKEAIEKTSALDEPSTSAVVDYITDNSAKRQSQYTSDLPVQPFKETTETTGTLNE
ncbi:hypothetical protein DBV15_10332 [Temnothorax longispinosus]|uniref:Uncharacterized protein n=1 Tax=Temnothorax longispinosus TaxID=300112 RepID=A0A4S2L3K6_9HYME|nr:hypothetical protein DBV15_10332 [Temnothorax longispinosus]